MIDFTDVKSIVIPEGEVAVIARGNEILWKKMIAPAYTELEYIESTGTQWINTGIYPTDSTIKLEVKIAYSTTSTGQLMGSGTSGNERFNFGIESSRFRFGFGGSWFNANSAVLTADTEPHVWILDANTKTGSIDGVAETTTNTYSPAGARAVVLFARGTSTVAESSNRTRGKIYYAKIWNKGNLVRDFVPVLDTEGVPCMYDKVSEEFFYNNGTGNFLYGEKPTAPYKTELAYLESTGTQYLNTDKYAPVDTDIYVKFQINDTAKSSSNNGAIFGGRSAQTSNTCTLFFLASTSPQYFRFDRTGQTQVATGNEITIDTESVYEFVYEGNLATLRNLTTGENATKTINTPSTFSSNPLTLFAVSGGTVFKGKVFEWKYWENGTLSQHLIPVLDWNDKPCMYDKVSGEFFYNAGTGEFLYSE